MALLAIFAHYRLFISQHRKGICLVLFTVAFVAYLAIGSFMFIMVEGSQTKKMQDEQLAAKMKVLSKYPGVPMEALDELMAELRSLGIRGIVPLNTTSGPSFADGVFFSATLLTTIGYGHITPTTVAGKLIVMVYTAFGIPLTLLLLACYVNRMMKLSEIYKACLFRKLQSILKPIFIRLAHVSTLCAFIVLGCFILPAFVYSHLEPNWSIFESIYFCFISLTTVGLGDYVPALNTQQPYSNLYKYGATFYIITGITIMMFMMAMTAEFQQNYNCCYHEPLPFTIAPEITITEDMAVPSTEKIPIKPSSLESYGSILSENHRLIEENFRHEISVPIAIDCNITESR